MKHLAHQVKELDAEIDTTNASRCLAKHRDWKQKETLRTKVTKSAYEHL